jgi:alpha-tubulin suppressor-like RCC1 family protein
MISSKKLEERANEIIAQGGLTELQILQLSSIPNFLSNAKSVVSQVSDLPDATLNSGNLIYVTAEEDFYFSDGEEWVNSFNSSYAPVYVSYAWGSNPEGRLGDGTTTFKSSPVTVVGALNWAQVAGGQYHSVGITTDGIAYAWGNGSFGRLGNNGGSSQLSPVTVVGGITNWAQVDGGSGHSLGVTSTGIAYAWGFNGSGQLGDNSTTSRLSPVTVVGGITNWSQISTAGSHSLGVTSTGIAYSWGFNDKGQLGDNTTTSKSSPVTVVGGITNWAQVSAGRNHSLGLTSGGILYSWGNNSSAVLGGGFYATSRSSPVTVLTAITNWEQVSAGGAHNLGITTDGIAYSWGGNSNGELGTNDTSTKFSPATVVGGITNWSQVGASKELFDSTSFGLTDTGVLYAWGRNTSGQLGVGNTTNQSSPTIVVGGTNWSQIAVGRLHVLATTQVIKGFNEP